MHDFLDPFFSTTAHSARIFFAVALSDFGFRICGFVALGFDPIVCERLTVTLLHFLWQGAAIGVVAAVVGRMLLRASSQVRYMIHFAALVSMFCCLPISPQKTQTVVTTSSGEADPETERYVSWLAPYVTGIYLAGVVMLLVRLVRSAWLTRRLGSSATPITESDLLNRMRIQAERPGLRVLPALRWCHEIPVPVVIGVLRPVVLLPAYAATVLTPDQLQAVIAHELAHVRRNDLVMNVLQRVIESLLFFHPAVWWVSRQITNEREQACDELVLTVGPGRAQYADALVRMPELSCQRGQLPVTALAATGSSTTAFKRRVLKVLEMDAAPSLRPSRIAAVMASLVVLFALGMPLFLSGSLAGGRTSKDDDSEEIANHLNLDDERAAWRELDRLGVFSSDSARSGVSASLRTAEERNDQEDVAKDRKILDTIPTTADFWQVPVQAWSHIGRQKSLTQVRFVASDLRGQAGHLRELTNLQFTFVTGKGVEQLANFPSLEQFSVDEWYLLTPASMRKLGSLKNLRRVPRLPSGATELIEPLAGLRQLEALEIAGGDLTDAGVRRLRERVPNCQIIRTKADYEALIAANDDTTAPPKAADPQPEIKVGMTFNEVIRLKGKHYRPQHGMGKGQLFLYYDDLSIGVENHPRGERGGTVFRVDPIGENVEFLLGDTPYADSAQDEPVAQPPAPVVDPLRVELIGLTYDTVPKRETWQTNGQPKPVPEWVQQLPKLDGEDKGKPAPLFLYEVHGLRAKPSFRHRYQPAVVSGDDELPEGRPYRMAVLYEDLKPERFQPLIWGEHPAVRITDEPWGPWRTITNEGQFAEPLDPNTLYCEGYEMVTLHGFRPLTKKPNDPEPAADAVRTGLVLKHPQDYDALYAIEIEAVPSTAGPQLVNVFTSRPVQSVRNKADDGWDMESEWPVDSAKIDHLRYRIRPFRHRFEFQEVAHKQYERPATSAPFEVIHKKLEHDMPKPLAGARAERAQLAEAADRPHFDLQIVDAVNQQPISGADVRVRYYVSSWQPNKVTPPKIADVDQQFQTDAKAMFPVSFPAEMQGLTQYLQVSVRHPDYVIEQSFGAWQVTAEMAANPAKAKEKFFPKGVISLKPGFEISGQILMPDGKPAQCVSLYAAWQMPEYLNMPPHAVTDADGRYKFRVGGFNETYLFIIPTDAVALSIPIQEQYGEHPVVKLEAGTVITGRVLDEKGQPLKDAVVQGNGNDTVYTGFPKPMARVATDAEGRYKLPPMKLPVDVKVDRFGYLGGWSRSYASPEGAYLPVMVRAPGADASGSSVGQPLVIDFHPAETVTLTARAYNEKGNLSVDEYIELVGMVPDPRAAVDQRGPNWRGSFRSVPGQVGVFQLKAPKGLVNATIDMTNSGSNSSQNIWTRAVRDEEKLEGSRTKAGWAVLDRDDDTIIVGTAP